MKRIFSIIAIALIGAFVLSSCNKNDYETEPLKTVTISGTVKARNDLTIEAPNQKNGFTNVPQGTKILFKIKADDLCHSGTTNNVYPGYDYSTLQYEATVDNNGNYSIELPCVNFKTTAVDIIPVNYKNKQRDQEKIDNAIDPNTGLPMVDPSTGLTYRLVITDNETIFSSWCS